MHARLIRSLSVVFAASLAVAGAHAGPLTPPAGAPSGTDKPLSEVEPRIAINSVNTPGDADSRYRITQPGSYYLTRTTGISGAEHGIEIASDNVTIDLMGFTLFSADPFPIGSPPISLDGIRGDPAGGSISFYYNITIRNGVIRGFGEDGINVRGRNCRFEDLQLDDNLGRGLKTFSSSLIAHCHAFRSGGNGFEAASNSVFLHCTAEDNGGVGFDIGEFGMAMGCASSDNDEAGFAVKQACRVVDCVAFSSPIGFDVGPDSQVSGCVAALSGVGIYARSGDGRGPLISACLVSNGGTGILLEGSSYVVDNRIDGCTNSGIRVEGSHNRIEGNHVRDTLVDGFDVVGSGNLLVRNTAADNGTDYDIVAGNRYGTIVNLIPPGTPAVSGPSSPSTVMTTDPWANFAH
ncbi:MAG: right-handed parallel beta-helix repeat-containing protein [Planctomycetota bacterium]